MRISRLLIRTQDELFSLRYNPFIVFVHLYLIRHKVKVKKSAWIKPSIKYEY